MLSLTVRTKFSAQQVIRRALVWFGPKGLGLVPVEQQEGCIFFEGGGGFVRITVCAEKQGSRAQLFSREWEEPLRSFAASLS